MVSVLIVTPLLQGEILHPDVVRGVSRLSSPWLVVSGQAVYADYQREYSINHTRALLQAEAKRTLDVHSHVLLLDSDVVVPDCDFITPMLAVLNSGAKSTCIQTKPERDKSHIVAACALVTVDVYLAIRYMDAPYLCQCSKLAALGGMQYVNGIIAHEIKRD